MKRFFVVMVALLCMSLFLVVPALAAEAVAANPVGEAIAHVLHADIAPIIAALLSALLGIVLDKIRKKFNLDISQQKEEQLMNLARQAVALAEEKGAALIKSNVSSITGRSKLDMAIAHIISMAPRVSVEQADALVHTVLARTRNVGATGAQAL